MAGREEDANNTKKLGVHHRDTESTEGRERDTSDTDVSGLGWRWAVLKTIRLGVGFQLNDEKM
jgi:hypothetical protein